MKVCKECGDEAAFICIEDGRWYCNNCVKLMNVNNMGEKDLYYHFFYVVDGNSEFIVKKFVKLNDELVE